MYSGTHWGKNRQNGEELVGVCSRLGHQWSGHGVGHCGFGSEDWAEIDLGQNRQGHWVVRFDKVCRHVGWEVLFKASRNQRGYQLAGLQMHDAKVGLIWSVKSLILTLNNNVHCFLLIQKQLIS